MYSYACYVNMMCYICLYILGALLRFCCFAELACVHASRLNTHSVHFDTYIFTKQLQIESLHHTEHRISLHPAKSWRSERPVLLCREFCVRLQRISLPIWFLRKKKNIDTEKKTVEHTRAPTKKTLYTPSECERVGRL